MVRLSDLRTECGSTHCIQDWCEWSMRTVGGIQEQELYNVPQPQPGKQGNFNLLPHKAQIIIPKEFFINTKQFVCHTMYLKSIGPEYVGLQVWQYYPNPVCSTIANQDVLTAKCQPDNCREMYGFIM